MSMEQAIERLLNFIRQDYHNWMSHGKSELQVHELKMIEEFNAELEVQVAKKYIKIISGSAVWGFIVNVDDDPKFKKGDILKPAGWKGPAKNAARGNVFEQYQIQWTGPRYLKG